MPIQFATVQTLVVFERYEYGMMLRSSDGLDVLLPKNEYVNQKLQVGDNVDVFIYADRNQKLAATLKIPFALPGEIAALKVTALNEGGNWLDWGLHFDLRLPDGEVTTELNVGDTVLVKIIADHENLKVYASNFLEDFVEDGFDLARRDEVEVQFYRETPLGYSVIVNGKYLGLIYESNLYGYYEIGTKKRAWVDKVREDGDLDIVLKAPGFQSSTDILQDELLQRLKDFGGSTQLGDKSEPALISDAFEMSKKSFKKTIGNLMKSGKIEKFGEGYKLVD